MHRRRADFLIVPAMLLCSIASLGAPKCIPAATPPKLPAQRHSGRSLSSQGGLRIQQLGQLYDTWKPATRRQVGTVQAGSAVEVLEDLIVIDSPDIVRVMQPIEELKLNQGDQILRYAHLGEGFFDIWANGCWYEDLDASFIIEPDGGGCGGEKCSAKVTKPGLQAWWFRIKLPDGKTGWTQSDNIDLGD